MIKMSVSWWKHVSEEFYTHGENLCHPRVHVSLWNFYLLLPNLITVYFEMRFST